MGFFGRRRALDPIKEYSSGEIVRRSCDIPVFKDLPGFRGHENKSPISVDEDIFSFAVSSKKPIPASIEYFFDKKVQQNESKEIKKPLKKESVRTKEIPDLDKLLFEQVLLHDSSENKNPESVLGETKRKEIDFTKDQDIVDFAKASLADEDSIALLENKHMRVYSILSKIQDIHVTSNFKSIYDIQDKISYLLNHRTLLYKSLVDELLIYLDSIIEKMDSYYLEIFDKQQKFNRYNKKVSELKQYKFKTDDSIKMISEDQKLAHEELEDQKKNAENTP